MNMSNRRKIYKGMSAQTVVTLTLGILGIIYFSVMSRLLTKEDFGYFAIITAVTSVLASISEAGLGSAIIQNKNAGKLYFQTAWTLSLLIGLFFCFLLYFCAGIMSQIMVDSNALEFGYRIMSFSLIFYAINSVGRAIIIKKLNFLQYGFFDIIGYALSASIGVLMAYKGFGFYAVIVAMLLHQTFLGILVAIANREFLALKIKRAYIRQIVTYGGWLTGNVIVRNITDQLDKLITTKWIPVASIGEYSRPTGLISQITGNINGIFDTILFPILSGINDNKDKINVAYEKSVSLVVLFSLILCAVFILGAETIIAIFLGENWVYLTYIFQIVSVSIVLLSYNRIADCFFRSLGIVKRYFVVRCYTMVFTCICMYVGCQYGITGLAIGLVISRLLSTFVKIVYLSHSITLSRKRFYKENLQSWGLPMLLFAILFLLKTIIPYGSIITTCLFCIIISLAAICKPILLGKIFYENIYVVVIEKFFK